MSSLSWKLAGALLLIAVVSIGLMAFLTNRSTTKEFQQYVVQGNAMHAQGVGQSLSNYYSRQQSWNGIQTILPGLLRMSGDRLLIAGADGTVIADSEGTSIGQTADRLGLTGYGTPVIFSGREVGNSYYLSSGAMGWRRMGVMGGIMMGGQTVPVPTNEAESEFLSGVSRSLWISGLAAVALALLLGFLLTRQIIHPLRLLTKGARQISQGDLGYRVQAKSRDELGQLVGSFNSMAEHLQTSEQSRQRMTADIAHELRTPLTVIEGMVDGMLDGVFTPDREHLTTIKEQTALLTGLIGDLRELSLAESGQLKLELAEDDVVDLVRHKLEQAQLSASEKKLQLEFKAEGTVPKIYLDHRRIEQVVMNLLTNAIRHTPAGGSIAVSIKAVTASVENLSGILVSIADTGEGIAATHLPHIFERFYRASNSRSRGDGGTGLGLAIVKHLVQAHGGKVWAESQPGKGSTFFVLLPLKH